MPQVEMGFAHTHTLILNIWVVYSLVLVYRPKSGDAPKGLYKNGSDPGVLKGPR